MTVDSSYASAIATLVIGLKISRQFSTKEKQSQSQS